jgi:hypothetical protein
MNTLMNEIYVEEESSWDMDSQNNREDGYLVATRHYGPYLDTYDLNDAGKK